MCNWCPTRTLKVLQNPPPQRHLMFGYLQGKITCLGSANDFSPLGKGLYTAWKNILSPGASFFQSQLEAPLSYMWLLGAPVSATGEPLLPSTGAGVFGSRQCVLISGCTLHADTWNWLDLWLFDKVFYVGEDSRVYWCCRTLRPCSSCLTFKLTIHQYHIQSYSDCQLHHIIITLTVNIHLMFLSSQCEELGQTVVSIFYSAEF